MVARRAVADEHHVLRYAPKSKRFLHPETAEPLGISPAAFAIRPGDEGGLSVTEVEHYGAMSADTRRLAAAAFRESQPSRKLGAQAAFAWARVSVIKAIGTEYGKGIRVVHSPVDGNPGHAEMRHFTDDDLDLLDFFATDVFSEYEVVADMGIPARAEEQ